MEKTKVQRHMDICKELNEMTAMKDHDYGNSTHDTYKRFGIVSYLTRLCDKLNRATVLANKPEDTMVVDERLEDTLLDMANYCIMAVDELRQDGEKETDTTILHDAEELMCDCEHCEYRNCGEEEPPCSKCKGTAIYGTEEYKTRQNMFAYNY